MTVYSDPTEDLINKASREMRTEPMYVSTLAWSLWSTRDYARCARVSLKYRTRCVELPEHDGHCRVITPMGTVERVKTDLPSPSLLRLVELYEEEMTRE